MRRKLSQFDKLEAARRLVSPRIRRLDEMFDTLDDCLEWCEIRHKREKGRPRKDCNAKCERAFS